MSTLLDPTHLYTWRSVKIDVQQRGLFESDVVVKQTIPCLSAAFRSFSNSRKTEAIANLASLVNESSSWEPTDYIFHATTPAGAAGILKSGINLYKCHPLSDFGRGFYTALDLPTAIEWGREKAGFAVETDILVFHFPAAVRRQAFAGGI